MSVRNFFIKLIPIKSLRRQARANEAQKEAQKAACYLSENYVLPFLNGELKHYEFAPLKKFENDKIIWQFWFQGTQNAPALVQKCFDSVKRQMGDEWQIVILDENNLSDYINFPSFVLQKLKEGVLSKTFFSDLLRVCLLATYGGVWLDATIYLSGKIPATWLSKDFFALQRSLNPPQDYKAWQSFNYGYFIWDKDFKVRFLSSFIITKANHPIITALQDILLAYWQRENNLIHYFALQIIFELLLQDKRYAKFNCAITNDTDAHLLQLHAKKPFSESLWQEIQHITPLHKLTYFKNLDANSMAGQILNLKGQNK